MTKKKFRDEYSACVREKGVNMSVLHVDQLQVSLDLNVSCRFSEISVTKTGCILIQRNYECAISR